MSFEIKKLDKDSLRAEFAKDYKKYYSTKLFDAEGFERYRCKECGKYFWSTEKRETCDDPDHTPYSFFKEKPKDISYVEMWKKFADYFKKNGHEIIDKYPVVSRWRPDLYFTIASIQDFQRIENGRMFFEYSANPLLVPQICLRFKDIENVGVTGRHFTSFMMTGQHAFNYPKEGYWKDKTIDLNYKFLTETIGVKKSNLVYSEDVWAMADFSEFGPCLEFFSGGLELGNNVFTQFEYSDGKVKELAGQVVDVGWGFERQLWFYTGHNNAYEAVFSDILKGIKKNSGINFDNKLFSRFAGIAAELNFEELKDAKLKESELLGRVGIKERDYNEIIKPMQAVYAVLDHTRTLLFAISDGALPSNVGGGYNLRIILRRALDFIEEYKINVDILDIAKKQASELHSLYPELKENLELLEKVVIVERERYNKNKEKGRNIVQSILAKSSKIDAKEMKVLYESNGITPELILSIAAKNNSDIKISGNLYEEILEGDFVKKEKIKRLDISLPELPKTEQLYYKFEEQSKSKILFVKGNKVVLDKTPFYPEGGGQAADRGMIGGIKVREVEKIAGAVVHVLEEDVEKNIGFEVGAFVIARVDHERRRRLMAHHTATHLISGAARQVLGKHAWQEGARKEADKAHIDIAHYDSLKTEEVKAIEDRVNIQILEGIKVEANEMERGDAERKFGFGIYQGHGVPAKNMRIIVIRDKDGKLIDAEACGGMHVAGKENYLGLVKIINYYKIHDGINRIEFVAGQAAFEYFQKENAAIGKISEVLNSDLLKSYDKLISLIESNKDLQKKLSENVEHSAKFLAEELEKEVKDKKFFAREISASVEMMREAAKIFTERNKDKTILFTNYHGEAVCIAGKDSGFDAVEQIKKELSKKGFVGGGSRFIAQGKFTRQ